MRLRMAGWILGLAAAALLLGGCRGRLFRDRDEDVLYCYPIQCQPATTQVCPPGTVYAPNTTIQSRPMVCCPQ